MIRSGNRSFCQKQKCISWSRQPSFMHSSSSRCSRPYLWSTVKDFMGVYRRIINSLAVTERKSCLIVRTLIQHLHSPNTLCNFRYSYIKKFRSFKSWVLGILVLLTFMLLKIIQLYLQYFFPHRNSRDIQFFQKHCSLWNLKLICAIFVIFCYF